MACFLCLWPLQCPLCRKDVAHRMPEEIRIWKQAQMQARVELEQRIEAMEVESCPLVRQLAARCQYQQTILLAIALFNPGIVERALTRVVG